MLEHPIPALLLPQDRALPMAGLGTWRIVEEGAMRTAVTEALACGIRMFDTASFYQNEDLLGDALAASGTLRNELYLISKIWNTAQQLGDIRGAVERSLDRLRVDYLDLYLIHWPVPGCFPRTWQELLFLQEEGLIRTLGVSNFEADHLELLMQTSGLYPSVNQIECHPLRTRKDLVEYCQNRGILVQAYAPLARGAYQDRPILEQIGSRCGKTAAQVGLRYLIQRNISVIPKSVVPERIRENAALFDFTLTEAEMQSIDELDENFRTSTIPEELQGMYES